MPIFSSMAGGSRKGFQAPASSLYLFTSHIFSNCSVSGRGGPTLTQMRAAYNSKTWAQNAAFLSQGAYQGYQKWTVPANDSYIFDVVGAGGGSASGYSPNYPGRGTRVQATIDLVKGEFLIIVVGQQGQYGGYAGGGGGGSFVIRAANGSVLVAAGAGAGARFNENMRTAYTDASDATIAKPIYNPNNPTIGGGGGFLSAGVNGSHTQGGGGYNNGMVGSASYDAGSGAGGFGGGSGGEATSLVTGGCGGGYSGGGSDGTYGRNGYGGNKTQRYASGGGSYATGSNITITVAYGAGSGSIAIYR